MRTLRLAVAVASLAALPVFAEGGGGTIGSGTRTEETCATAITTTDTTCRGGYLGSGNLSVKGDRRTGVVTVGTVTTTETCPEGQTCRTGYFGSGHVVTTTETCPEGQTCRGGYFGSGLLVARDAQPVVTIIESGDSAIYFVTLE